MMKILLLSLFLSPPSLPLSPSPLPPLSFSFSLSLFLFLLKFSRGVLK